MDYQEFLQVWSPLFALILAPAVTWFVQKAKNQGVDPLPLLGIVSIIMAFAYGLVAHYVSEEMLLGVLQFSVMVGGTANLIYSVLKSYTSLVKKE